jgi:quercetin dioxygenase-like cupin family protein
MTAALKRSGCVLAAAVAAALTLGALAAPALAQNTGIKRTVLLKADVSVPGREAVVANVELAPGAAAGRHSHPGDEISYIQEGEGELLIDGEEPRRVTAGQAFVIKAGVVHDARNTGSAAMKLTGVYVVEKGQPLASPAK